MILSIYTVGCNIHIHISLNFSGQHTFYLIVYVLEMAGQLLLKDVGPCGLMKLEITHLG